MWMMRSVQFNIKFGSRRCSAAFVHKGPLLITGVTGLSAMVKRRSVRLTTAWGVRPQALSGSDKYSPPVFIRTQRELGGAAL